MTRVLNLVTKAEARFYDQQVRVLDRRGTDCTTVPVPGRHDPGPDAASRSVLDYIRFYPTVLRRSVGDYDLVHANSGLTAPAALAQPRRPVVCSLWGTELTNRYGPVTRACAGRCDAVVVMSERMARTLDRECFVVPHGVDRSLFSPQDRAAARDELGWEPSARHVLFPYSPRRVVKDYPRARRLVDRAAERVDADVRLQTLSGEPHERVSTAMNAADTLILTSEQEGSPNSVKEALACDLPVVSTPVGDVPERLDGVSPSTVGDTDAELVDGLVSILQNPRRSNGREAVEPVSLERMAERLEAIYADVLDGRRDHDPANGDESVPVRRYDPDTGRVSRVELPA
ncbi:glycosyltransferase family 4 protein [Halorarum halophilum]|uniref:Glycosyltransferase family 4 protein n=1 Tax=Halorarum halophilum TaxID=2743090 RepID=A0A7D5K2B6_9EURY|nr:glycosyltransferase family 4 protein [Halobaculum halophilum]QLG28701.1 glycosyltransferase family 4 protein [Halobaculum halophilum]